MALVFCWRPMTRGVTSPGGRAPCSGRSDSVAGHGEV